jgi:two-component system response regulator AtoC
MKVVKPLLGEKARVPAAQKSSSTNSSIADLPSERVIFGCSEPMRALKAKIEKVAQSDLPVLIEGESGTGKDVLARLIHFWSARADGPFVKVSCPAIPGNLLESELFGYEQGAFTGAWGVKPGRVETANGGTFFLDEISEMEAELQAKLLQLLQEGRFVRIGATAEQAVEVRFICSTNRDLQDLVDGGAFRQDLFYRINVIHLRVPPLRERTQDIPILVDYLLQLYNRKYRAHAVPFSRNLMRLFQNYSWPGNIRQLENLVKRYVVLGSEEPISADLMEQIRDGSPAINFDEETIPFKAIMRQIVRDHERKIILQALHAHHWNRKETARALGLSYQALLYKMRQTDLAAPSKAEDDTPQQPASALSVVESRNPV